LGKVDGGVGYLFGKTISVDGLRKQKGKKYVLGLVDEYLARWTLEPELEFSMTR
jgi:hypothetical protein